MTRNADIFDIERYGVEDGPGIRTVVFFKGCNLRCRWCQNPESHHRKPEVMYYRSDCIACGRCVEACSQDAIRNVEGFGFVTDHESCNLCGACLDACYTGARKIIGKSMSTDEIMAEIEKDKSFYDESGGGVTFTGGEALLQSEVLTELARRCRSGGIHTALETAGAVPWNILQGVLQHIDLCFFDLKHIDSEAHRRWTDVPLERILENLRLSSAEMVKMIVRIPIIPDVNNDEDTIRNMFRFLKEETEIREVELLPFHRLGGGKYEGLGLEYAMAGKDNLGPSDCEPLAEIGRAMGLVVRSGGGES